MNIEDYRDYCLSLPGTTEGFPFDGSTLVFKVMGKIYALTNVDKFEFINLKCDPEEAVLLRERYPEVKPGYHMSKKHWNSVYTNGDLTNKQFLEWTKNSYDLVVSSLSKKKQEELKGL